MATPPWAPEAVRLLQPTQCTPTHHPSPSIHTGWVVASGNRTLNLTFNTSGSPTDGTSYSTTGDISFVERVLKVRTPNWQQLALRSGVTFIIILLLLAHFNTINSI